MWSWYYSRWKAFIAIITRAYQETKLSLLMVPLRVSHCDIADRDPFQQKPATTHYLLALCEQSTRPYVPMNASAMHLALVFPHSLPVGLQLILAE